MYLEKEVESLDILVNQTKYVCHLHDGVVPPVHQVEVQVSLGLINGPIVVLVDFVFVYVHYGTCHIPQHPVMRTKTSILRTGRCSTPADVDKHLYFSRSSNT